MKLNIVDASVKQKQLKDRKAVIQDQMSQIAEKWLNDIVAKEIEKEKEFNFVEVEFPSFKEWKAEEYDIFVEIVQEVMKNLGYTTQHMFADLNNFLKISW